MMILMTVQRMVPTGLFPGPYNQVAGFLEVQSSSSDGVHLALSVTHYLWRTSRIVDAIKKREQNTDDRLTRLPSH